MFTCGSSIETDATRPNRGILKTALVLMLGLVLAVEFAHGTTVDLSDVGVPQDAEVWVDHQKIGVSPCQYDFEPGKRYTVEYTYPKGNASGKFGIQFSAAELSETRLERPTWIENVQDAQVSYPNFLCSVGQGHSPRQLGLAMNAAVSEARTGLVAQLQREKGVAETDDGKTLYTLTGSRLLGFYFKREDDQYVGGGNGLPTPEATVPRPVSRAFSGIALHIRDSRGGGLYLGTCLQGFC